jgi:hypothetical protein
MRENGFNHVSFLAGDGALESYPAVRLHFSNNLLRFLCNLNFLSFLYFFVYLVDILMAQFCSSIIVIFRS